VVTIKKLMEFGSKISKRGKDRYYINIPSALVSIAREHYGKRVYVVVYAIEKEEEARAEPRSNK